MTIADAVVDRLPIAVYAVNNDRFVYVNTKFAETLGYTKQEILDLASAVDIIPGGQKEIVSEILRRRAAGTLGELRYITTARRRDGTLIDAEIHASVADIESGRLAIGVATNVAPHMELSRKLNEREQYFRSLTEGISDVIFVLDPLGTVTYVSQSIREYLGGQWTDWVGRSLVDVIHPDDRERFSRALNDLVSSRSFGPEEFCMRSENGSWRDIEVVATNLLAHPQVQGLVFKVRDVTERRKIERAQLSDRLLRSQDEERRRIARQLHDTTAQNLAALRWNLSRINQSALGAEPVVRNSVDESIALADQSIMEIRTLSYLLHTPLIDVAGLLPSLRWFTRGFEERSGIKVTLDVPDDLDRLPAESETALFRIIQEALTNIQRHSGSAVAHIRLTRDQQNLRLEVVDEGIGLPIHLRDHGEALAAAGVGIAGMRQRAKELGGSMQIESQNRGTRMAVTLPIAKES